MIPYSFSIRNKILRNQTDNNLSINSFKQKTQNTLDTKDNFKKNEKIKRIIYQKNIGKTSTGLNEVINKEKNNHIYKSVISVNNIKNFTLYDREKENQIPNKIKFKTRIPTILYHLLLATNYLLIKANNFPSKTYNEQ